MAYVAACVHVHVHMRDSHVEDCSRQAASRCLPHQMETADTRLLGVVPGRHRIAAQGVRPAGHRLQMLHACLDPTEMVDDQAVRDGALMLKLPGGAMSFVFSAERAKLSIARPGVEGASPQPMLACAIDP
jgi:hypothetical protein